jgi:hypothetical protein
MGCCLGALLVAGAPRVALVFMWLFTDRLEVAFDSVWFGLVGFVLLPYTTVAYAAAFSPLDGVSGLGWAIVVLGLVFDLGSYSSGAYSQRQASAAS